MSQDYHDKIDDSGCYFCARQTDIEAHHIVPQRFNGSDSRENLVGVCERCHKKLERLYDKRFYEQLGITDEQGERHHHYPCAWCGDEQVDCKVEFKDGNTEWICLNCATRSVGGRRTVIEDTTGKYEHREQWVRYAEYPLQSMTPRGFEVTDDD